MRAPSWRACLVTAAVVAMLALAGCGPGVGGTGTGGAAFSAFGATAASVCSSAIAADLGCAQAPAPATSSGAGSSAGTLPVQFVDAAGQVTLDLNGNVARLASSCLRLAFSGEFGRNAAGEGFFGSYQLDASGSDVLATLSAVPGPTGGALTVELRDLEGKVVLGPLPLHRAVVPVSAPSPC